MPDLTVLPKQLSDISSWKTESYKVLRGARPGPSRRPHVPLHSSASDGSLLNHRVPSATFNLEEEMREVVSRHAGLLISRTGLNSHPASNHDSLASYVESLGLGSQQAHSRPEGLLLPAPGSRSVYPPLDPVECRLSEVSSQWEDGTQRRASSFRGTPPTPAQLTNLRLELQEITVGLHTDYSLRPVTPVPSLTHSPSSFSTTEETPSSLSACEYSSNILDEPTFRYNHRSPPDDGSQLKDKPFQIYDNVKVRDVSPLTPGPIHSDDRLGVPLTRSITDDSDVDPSYRPFRPVPNVPAPSQEISYVEWDDDDEESRLTRMKKSFTDLRTAAKLRADGATWKRGQKKAEVVVPERIHNPAGLPPDQVDRPGSDSTTSCSIRSMNPTKLTYSASMNSSRRATGEEGSLAANSLMSSSSAPHSPPAAVRQRMSRKNKSIMSNVRTLGSWVKRLLQCV